MAVVGLGDAGDVRRDYVEAPSDSAVHISMGSAVRSTSLLDTSDWRSLAIASTGHVGKATVAPSAKLLPDMDYVHLCILRLCS